MSTWEDKPFYWIGPTASKGAVLDSVQGLRTAGHSRDGMPDQLLPNGCRSLEKAAIPTTWCSCAGPSAATTAIPTRRLSDLVKNWNAKYAYPKMVIATTSEAVPRVREALRRQDSRMFRGDFTPYWEDGAGSSARETAINRTAAERLVQAETLWAMLNPGPYPAERFSDRVAQRDPLRRTHLGRLQQHQRARRAVRQGSVEGQAGIRTRRRCASRASCWLPHWLFAATAQAPPAGRRRVQHVVAGRGPIWSSCRRSRVPRATW